MLTALAPLPKYPEPSTYYIAEKDGLGLRKSYIVRYSNWLEFEIPIMLTPELQFVSDLSSVPRILRAIYDRLAFGIRPPIVHDYLCKVKGVVVNLKTNEKIQLDSSWVHGLFKLHMEQDNIPSRRRFIASTGVKYFGPKWDVSQAAAV